MSNAHRDGLYVSSTPLLLKYLGLLLGQQSPYYDLDVTGLKTGHTEEAGYCLVASVARNNRELRKRGDVLFASFRCVLKYY